MRNVEQLSAQLFQIQRPATSNPTKASIKAAPALYWSSVFTRPPMASIIDVRFILGNPLQAMNAPSGSILSITTSVSGGLFPISLGPNCPGYICRTNTVSGSRTLHDLGDAALFRWARRDDGGIGKLDLAASIFSVRRPSVCLVCAFRSDIRVAMTWPPTMPATKLRSRHENRK